MELNEITNAIKEKYKNQGKKINEENLKSLINGFFKWKSGTFYAKSIDIAIFEFINTCESLGRPLLDLFINITNKEINWRDLGISFSKIDIVDFVDSNFIRVYGYYEVIEGKSIFEDFPNISINYHLMDRIYYAIQYRLNELLFGVG